MKTHHSRYKIHAMNLLRLPTLILALLFVLGFLPKVEAQEECDTCVSTAYWQSQIRALNIQKETPEIMLAVTNAFIWDLENAAYEANAYGDMEAYASIMLLLSTIKSEASLLECEIKGIQDQIDAILDSIAALPPCSCDQLVACSSCYNPMPQCTCSPPEDQCYTCYNLLSQCTCPPPEDQCYTCNNPLSQCTCNPQP